MGKCKRILFVLFVLMGTFKGFAQMDATTPTVLGKKLSKLFPKAVITPIKNLEGYSESYQLVLEEPLDHNHPGKGAFRHFVYLSHLDFDSPTVIETEGYNARYVKNEVSELLKANQVIVEYRFYGNSRPDPVPWEYLTNDQAAADYHAITTKLKELYKGKWIATGISKGGETTLIYKSKYPNDVAVAIPYVAPLIDTQEDFRTKVHINTVGTPECREKIIQFQRILLQNKEAMLKEMEAYAEKKKAKFTEVSMEEALEYAALEFPFSFWQWGGKCEEIPTESALPKAWFDYMNKIVGIDFYNDEKYQELLPSFYQHMTELGYYGFDFTPVEDLLKVVKSTSNSRFAPKNIDIAYHPDYIKKVRDYVENKGDKIVYIYGGHDTWTSCAVKPNSSLDVLKMVLEGGSHATRIKHFSAEDQIKIMETLNRWLHE